MKRLKNKETRYRKAMTFLKKFEGMLSAKKEKNP
jgi:hypothetical protein